MASKLYEIAIQLNAKLGSSFSSVFKSAKNDMDDLDNTSKNNNNDNNNTRKSFLGLGEGMGKVVKAAAGLATAYISLDTIKNVASYASTASKVNAQMGAVLKSTGGAAGISSKQLISLADAQSKVTTFSKTTTEQAENMLLTFTNIKSKVFPQTVQATEDMATAMHMDATQAAMTLGKALNDPAKGLSKLTRQGVTFTAAQQKQIKAMQKAGNVAGAQKIMLQELEREFGGSAKAAGETLPGQIAKAKNSLMGAAASILSGIMPIINKLLPLAVKAIQNITDYVKKHQKDIINFSLKVVSVIQNVIKVATPIVQGLFNFISKHGQLVKSIIIGLGSALVVAGISAKVTGIIKIASKGIKGLEGAAKGAKIFQNLFGFSPQVLVVVAIIAAIAALAFLVIKNWKPIKAFFVKLWSDVSGVFNKVINSMVKAWNTVYNSVKTVFTNIYNFIKGIVSGIWNFIKGVINTGIGMINGILGGVNKVTGIINKIPGIHIGSIPTIPKLAGGGYIKHRAGGILANIGEGREDEIVSPVSKLQKIVNSNANNRQLQVTYQIFIEGNADKDSIYKGIKKGNDDLEKRIDKIRAKKHRLSLNPQ